MKQLLHGSTGETRTEIEGRLRGGEQDVDDHEKEEADASLRAGLVVIHVVPRKTDHEAQ